MKAAEEAEDGDQEPEISAYIRVGESQIVYKISSSSYKKLTAAAYNDLRHPEVFWADFSDVQQIDVSLEGNSYTLTSEKMARNAPGRIRRRNWELLIFNPHWRP